MTKHAEIPRIGRVSDESVRKGSGKSWAQWIQILERAGASSWPRKEIVTLLREKYALRPWWQQVVTTGYEIHKGRRQDGWNSRGEYSITATKSLALPRKRVWKAVCSREGMRCWLKPLADFSLSPGESFETESGAFGEVRTVKGGERIRLSWREDSEEKASIVQINVIAKPGGRSLLVIDHTQLREGRRREEIRQLWKDALAEFVEHLTVSESAEPSRPRSGRRPRKST